MQDALGYDVGHRARVRLLGRQQHQDAQRRQRHSDRLREPVIRHQLRFRGLRHGVSAASERGRVGVEDDVIGTHCRRAQAVRFARHRREIEHHDRVRRSIVPRVRQHRLFLVGHVDPAEARWLMVAPPKTRMLTVQGAKRFHECHQPLTAGVTQQMPFETDVVIPLVMRPEFRAHEEQRLAGTRDRVADERAEIREALPRIPGHLLEQ